MNSEIVVLGMGGTIAGRAALPSDNVGYRVGEVSIGELIDQIHADRQEEGLLIRSEQVLQKDSKDMMFSDWALLADRLTVHLKRPEVRGVVVTHGTDTLEEASFFISLVLPTELQKTKPVVFTCAMRPASSQSPDGPQNLRDALVVASTPFASGVLLSCAGEIHLGSTVRKAHSYRLNAFESIDSGPVGFIEEGRVRWCGDSPPKAWTYAGAYAIQPMPTHWPRIEIVMSYSNASFDLVQKLLSSPSGSESIDGLIIAGTGNGTVHSELLRGLQENVHSEVPCIISPRCGAGPVFPSVSLNCQFQLDVGALNPLQARIAMALQIAQLGCK